MAMASRRPREGLALPTRHRRDATHTFTPSPRPCRHRAPTRETRRHARSCEAIVRWLSYVPATANDLKPGMLAPADPVDRPVTGRPPADGSPYDVRELLDNADGTGLFDKGSFTETLAGWGKTVVAGRAVGRHPVRRHFRGNEDGRGGRPGGPGEPRLQGVHQAPGGPGLVPRQRAQDRSGHRRLRTGREVAAHDPRELARLQWRDQRHVRRGPQVRREDRG